MKINFVVDASGIFYRSLFTIGSFGSRKGERLLESDESKGIFMRKLATDFSALVKSVDNLSRVIVCLDSTSWRKQIEIEEGGYKISREKGRDDINVNWDAFFELTREFAEILTLRGYVISKVKDAEADDLLFLWARKLNSVGESVIMVTGDKDLHQVVDVHPNGSWTVALDPVVERRKVFLTKEAKELSHVSEESEVDIFNPDSWLSTPGDFLTALLSKNDEKIIDPVKVATYKVILGDNGDSVPSIFTWKDSKDETKIRSITENKLEKALSNLPPLTWKDLREGKLIPELTSAVNIVTKMNYSPEETERKIKRNIQLVVLHEDIIPQDIQTNFNFFFEKITSSPIHLTREAILEGTKWWSKKVFVPKSYEVSFDGIIEEEIEVISKKDPSDDAIQKAVEDIRIRTKKPDKGAESLF
jgi:5'-3' exonuclease